MTAYRTKGRIWHRLAFMGVLATALLLRLYHLGAPLLEGSTMSVKQVWCANKARAIAGPPFRPLSASFDFLDRDGRRLVLVEEVPLYTGLVGLCYRLVGEHEWLGRAWSILASLIAFAALRDLVKREFDRDLALVATFLFSLCPLAILYGQAFQPDLCMLACMLVSACCYHRHLDTDRRRWLVAAALTGLLGALFKYYALMVLLPLADMAARRRGWRAWFTPGFVFLGAAMAVPIFAWMTLVFTQLPNPAKTHGYFLFQRPDLITQPALYARFFDRFLWKDCGPVTLALLALGVVAAVTRSARLRPFAGWTVMGILFFFLLGPLTCCHSYYELMMLPAASVWAAAGWQALRGNPALPGPGSRLRAGFAVVALATAAVLHSPFVCRGQYGMEKGFQVLGERLNQLCSPAGKVIVTGLNGAEAVHYAHRQGWELQGVLAPDWRQDFARYRRLGAEYVGLYLNTKVSAEQRQSYTPLLRSLPVVEHRRGAWSAWGDHSGEFYILRLDGIDGSQGAGARP